MSTNAYDDDLSQTELDALAVQDTADKKITDAPNGTVPGVLEEDGDTANAALIADAEAEAARKAAEPAAVVDPAAAPAADPAADPAAATPPANETLSAFIARHKDKSPEQLAELLENRGKRSNKQAFQARRGKSPEQIKNERELLAAQRASSQRGTQTFKEKLENDPDAAASELHDRLAQQELERIAAQEAALDRDEANLRFDTAIEVGDKYIPDFRETYPAMVQFAHDVGYSQEEVNGIDDGRDLIILNLARIAGNLMQTKVIDTTGRLLPQIKAVNDTPQDPRLTAPAPIATHTGASGGGAALTLEQQAAAATTMSDADFEKLSPEMLNKLMGGR
jgi:hypothetical protein